jgi:hypothetical protein
MQRAIKVLIILAITFIVFAGIALYLRNMELNREIDILIEQGGYNE